MQILWQQALPGQIESRISLQKRAIKMAIAAAMRMNAEGIKIQISGRLNGAEMARSESYKDGRIPCRPLGQISIMHCTRPILLMVRLGIKVWIMKGEVYGKRELSPVGRDVQRFRKRRQARWSQENATS